MALRLPSDRFKELLVGSDLISAEDFESALNDSKRTGQDLSNILVSRGFITEDYLFQLYSDFFKTPLVKLRGKPIRKDLLNILPEDVARGRRVVIFDKTEEDGSVSLAMEDPSDLETLGFVQKYINAPVRTFLTTAKDLNYVYSLYGKEVVEDFQKVIEENVRAGAQLKETDEQNVAKELPIVNIVDAIFTYAISLNASDVHIEVQRDILMIRFRIDGVLHEIARIPKEIHPAIVARVKLLANLRIDEHNRPQDGRFRHEALGEGMDIRVSIMPTFYGEKVETRLLKASAKPMSLAELGMMEDSIKIIEDSIKRTYGMLLVVGPTGSGKTTTLYSILNMLNKPDVNIVTIEDPIEYDIRYVNQTQINTQAGITFASGLRAILRQDPNIIMVGEIRDEETAEISVHSALTGHLVLSCLHTNDAPTTVPRFIDMKVPPFLVSAVINTVAAQRLVRKICSDCVQSYEPTEEILASLKNQLENFSGVQNPELPKVLYKGAGCQSCGFTGYRGQMAIFEVLDIDEDMRRLINQSDFTLDKFRVLAKEKGMVSMFEDGVRKAKLGLTTIEEVMRVIRE